MYTKESLERLKQRINLVEVLGPHLELKASGSSYKGLCPFHDEKTPSFTVQRGSSHYHCFGCGAHGDAIEFLINHRKMRFSEAVEHLAAQYQLVLEKTEGEEKGPNKKRLHEALHQAALYFHSVLLHEEEGKQALAYLEQRGITKAFIERFLIGYAPKQNGLISLLKQKGFEEEILVECALLRRVNQNSFPFFSERITFPIHNAQGLVCGFSARKIREEVFGGKYINTPETAVFRKGHLLFGLHESRKRITKEKKALIVEGQLDTLRLIDAGMDCTVAAQGTAFGEGHVELLRSFGVETVYLAFDSDTAGLAAAEKVGHLFQKKGVEVFVVPLPIGSDPDSYVQKKGLSAFEKLLEKRIDYLSFLVRRAYKTREMHSPAVKNGFIEQVSKQVRSWDNEVMIYESLRKLAQLLDLPQEILKIGYERLPNTYIKRGDAAGLFRVDADLILESDCLRWMMKLTEAQRVLMDKIFRNVQASHFRNEAAREIFEQLLLFYQENKPVTRLELLMGLSTPEAQKLLALLDEKWINPEQAEEGVVLTLEKLLEREWMHQREAVCREMAAHASDEVKTMRLLKQLQELKNQKPVVR